MSDSKVGEAKAVLVFGEGDDAVSVVTTVSALLNTRQDGSPLSFTGPVFFDESVLSHLEKEVLPIVKQITVPLGVHVPCLLVSMANINAAAIREKGLRIQGASADMAVFLALFSASLDMPISDDVVTSGQIGFTGDIRMAKQLEWKIKAAVQHPEVHRFVYPALDADSSLKALTPGERDKLLEFLHRYRDQIELIEVKDIHDVLRAACSEEGILAAAFRNGYFHSSHHLEPTSPYFKSISFLTEGLEDRYWKCLERNLQSGENDAASLLIEKRLAFHAQRNEYPQEFGRRLEKTISSIPPFTRRTHVHFPLVPEERVLDILRSAQARDLRDVRSLLDALFGDRLATPRSLATEITNTPLPSEEENLLPMFLHELDPRTLAEKVTIAIDSARASFPLGSSVVQNSEEFYETIRSFYLHLMRWTHQVVEPADPRQVAAEADALLNRAFARRGGPKAALAEGMDGSQGGMPFILNMCFESYKADQVSKHVEWIFTETLDGLDYGQRLSVMSQVLDFLRPYLPDDLRDMTPEQLASEDRLVIQKLANLAANMNRLLLTL